MGISDLINVPGLINLDFADVKTVMENMGDAIMGTGEAHGEERAILASQQAINSPLLQDSSIKGAKGLLVNITGPSDMSIHELNSASSIIYEEAGQEANVILGCILDNQLTDEIQVTVIATGLNQTTNHMNTNSNRRSENLAPRFKPEKSNSSNTISSSTIMPLELESMICSVS